MRLTNLSARAIWITNSGMEDDRSFNLVHQSLIECVVSAVRFQDQEVESQHHHLLPSSDTKGAIINLQPCLNLLDMLLNVFISQLKYITYFLRLVCQEHLIIEKVTVTSISRYFKNTLNTKHGTRLACTSVNMTICMAPASFQL